MRTHKDLHTCLEKLSAQGGKRAGGGCGPRKSRDVLSSGSLSCFALTELSSYIAQVGLKLLNSRKPPSSASQITDNRRPVPRRLGPGMELGRLVSDCRAGLGQQKRREQPCVRAEEDRCLKTEKLSPDAVQQPAVNVPENWLEAAWGNRVFLKFQIRGTRTI